MCQQPQVRKKNQIQKTDSALKKIFHSLLMVPTKTPPCHSTYNLVSEAACHTSSVYSNLNVSSCGTWNWSLLHVLFNEAGVLSFDPVEKRQRLKVPRRRNRTNFNTIRRVDHLGSRCHVGCGLDRPKTRASRRASREKGQRQECQGQEPISKLGLDNKLKDIYSLYTFSSSGQSASILFKRVP